MLKYLRSVQTLLAFEAAGRHGRIKDAAEELHVTPSAVSRQIQMLEEDLGAPLFRRLHRGVALTPVGASYLAEVTEALRRLDRAGGAVRASGDTRALRISVLHGFAGNWLVPRLSRFQAAHADIDIRLEATSAYADFRHDDIDLAIRFGNGDWPGLHAERLLDLDLFPVCQPRLARGRPPIREPQHLAHHTWLEDVRVPDAWPRWLKVAGVDGLRPRRSLHYDNSQLVLDAAAAGLGVALTADLVAERYLRERRLTQLFAIVDRSPQTYHLVAWPQDMEKPPLRAFRAWIRSEMDAWRTRAARPTGLCLAQPRVRKDRSSVSTRGR
nr:glycine cleavage system transcriptional activator [uncultured bacterium]